MTGYRPRVHLLALTEGLDFPVDRLSSVQHLGGAKRGNDIEIVVRRRPGSRRKVVLVTPAVRRA